MIIENFPELVKFKEETTCAACKSEARQMLIHLTFIGESNLVKLNFDSTCYHTESERRGINEGSNE